MKWIREQMEASGTVLYNIPSVLHTLQTLGTQPNTFFGWESPPDPLCGCSRSEQDLGILGIGFNAGPFLRSDHVTTKGDTLIPFN